MHLHVLRKDIKGLILYDYTKMKTIFGDSKMTKLACRYDDIIVFSNLIALDIGPKMRDILFLQTEFEWNSFL